MSQNPRQRQRAENGTVSKKNNNGSIRLSFTYKSETLHVNMSLKYDDPLDNAKAEGIAAIIKADILSGQVDTSLKKYKDMAPSTRKKAKADKKDVVEVTDESAQIVTCFEYWATNIRHKDCDQEQDFKDTRSMLRRWGKYVFTDILEKLNTETIAASTYNKRKTLLNGFLKWGVKKGHFPNNPLEDVASKPKKKEKDPTRKPFTEDEIIRILKAFETDSCNPKNSAFKHSHYYPFVYFLFATGVRPAEAVGLQIKHLHLAKGHVEISEALAKTVKGTNMSSRKRKETKNGKVRFIPINYELVQALQRNIQNKRSDDLVFTSPRKNGAIDASKFLDRIFRAVLENLAIPYRVLYATRHTFSSTLIDKGVSPVTTAFLLGNNPETALRHYTHQMDLPKNLPLPSLGK